MSYPANTTIRERLPYSAGAFGLSDSEYDALIDDLRSDEKERIESWGSVVNAQSDAESLHDGSDPSTAFEEFTVTNTVDGAKAVREPRNITHRDRQLRGDLYFEQDKRRHRRDPQRARALPLPGRPVEDVVSVTETTTDTELIVGEDVYLESSAVLVLDEFADLAEWPDRRRNVEVEYTFGTDGVPSRIKQVLVDLVHWRLHHDETLPVSSESIDGDSVEYREPGAILGEAFSTVLSETEESHHGGVFSV